MEPLLIKEGKKYPLRLEVDLLLLQFTGFGQEVSVSNARAHTHLPLTTFCNQECVSYYSIVNISSVMSQLFFLFVCACFGK